MYLPHEILSDMVARSDMARWCLTPDQLSERQGLGKLLTDWGDHPDVEFAGDLGSVAILGMHMDGVQYTASMRAGEAKSILVASFNVVSAQGPDNKRIRQPLFVIRKSRLCACGCSGYHTIQILMDVLAWSMRCMLAGQTPSCRHDGTAWTDHDLSARKLNATVPRGALLQIRGDWEGLCQCFRVRSYSSDAFCWMCEAKQFTRDHMHFSNFAATAPHRQSLVTHESYMMACAREASQPSHLFRCPGTMLQHLGIDSMHAGDLGCFQDALGSLFWLEITNKSWYTSMAVGLQSLNRDLKSFDSANPDLDISSVYPLALTQIIAQKPGYPYLKCKAAQTRHLAEFGLQLARRHRNGDANRNPFAFRRGNRLSDRTAEHLDALVAMFEGMVRYHQACRAVPFVEQECRAGMYRFLQALAALHRLWREGLPEARRDNLPFNLRPKAHVMQHLVEDKLCLWGSPADFWCYRDEDYIGSVKLIAAKTKHPKFLEAKVMQKLRILTKLDARV